MSRVRQSASSATGVRRWILFSAVSATVLGLLHHADHIVRGNHVGWPLIPEVTPFTFSLLVYAFLLPGFYLTARGRILAGYWLAIGLAGLTLVVTVHFVPTEDFEAPIRDIYQVYANPVIGALALLILVGLISSLAVLVAAAAFTLRSSLTRR